MKSLAALFTLLVCGAHAQQAPMFLAVGGGYAEEMGMTATLGLPLSDNNYMTASVDFFARVNPATNKRAAYSTVRPGYQRVLYTGDLGRAGLLSFAIRGDLGGTFGNDAVVGALSTGASVVWSPAAHQNVGLYASYRAIRSPQQDPAAPSVQNAVSFGVLLKLTKQP